MDKMADVLGRAGAWCGQNKYLSAIKNATSFDVAFILF